MIADRDDPAYAAFVSYRHTEPDRSWARWLHASLETYRIPKRIGEERMSRRLGRVFRDEEELAASPDLSERIEEALQRANHLIVVCSTRTPDSRWVDEEVRRFRAMGRASKVLALLIEGEPETAFPPSLRDVEPLAADVRPAGGVSRRALRRTALLKLLAGMLDVPYDDLRRRDEERSRRRLMIAAGVATVAAAAFLTLAGFALAQWNRAERELKASRAQNLAAQSQIAYDTPTRLGDESVAGTERGVLLALESLRTDASVAGDQVLRAGMRKLGGAALEIPLRPGETLAGIGPKGAWVLAGTDAGPQIIDRDQRTYRAPSPGETAGAVPLQDNANEGVLARSPDGALSVERSEEGIGGWIFANAAVKRTRDQTRIALLPHEWQLRYAFFTRDSRFLVTVTASAGMDAADPSATAPVGSTVRVWDAQSWTKVTEVSLANEGGIEAAAASADGEWLATAVPGADHPTVLLWPLRPELARTEACRRLTRNLSPSEWLTFVTDGPPRATCPGLPIVSE